MEMNINRVNAMNMGVVNFILYLITNFNLTPDL
ncbi:hypothetical protein SAMN05421640_1558 [Ekhidna lutea]|uniref:Uncharacterized protein n=1 Tax=Ekhidna lutea TaxID=447679 RepID=A0A239HXB1_EKHLU|nr:hypothetical protein SAMN05421640_1558 [Ekhidna lutea]